MKRLKGDKIMRKIRGNYKKAARCLCAAAVCAGLLAAGATASAAGESGQFRSKGSIRYQDAGGQEIILDAGDFDVLFQYAAEGKGGLSEALGGVGTKLGQRWRSVWVHKRSTAGSGNCKRSDGR